MTDKLREAATEVVAAAREFGHTPFETAAAIEQLRVVLRETAPPYKPLLSDGQLGKLDAMAHLPHWNDAREIGAATLEAMADDLENDRGNLTFDEAAFFLRQRARQEREYAND